MNKFYGAAAFAAVASATVLNREAGGCCFQITSSGGVNGVMGQFEDGQNRINGSYPPATYCYENGGIFDGAGRGCIVTIDNDATRQFQCDQGKQPSYGFTINNEGTILYQGTDQFYACPYITEYNIYTQWLKDQDKCQPIKLHADATCAAGAHETGPHPPGYTGDQGVPAGSYGPAPPYPTTSAPAIPPYGQSTGKIPGYPAASQSVQVPPGTDYAPPVAPYTVATQPASAPAVPGHGSQSSASKPVYGPSSQASASTPGVPGYGAQTSAPGVPSYSPSSAPTVPASSLESSPVQGSHGIPGYGSSTATTSFENSPVQTSGSSMPGYAEHTSMMAVPPPAPGHITSYLTLQRTETVSGSVIVVQTSVPQQSVSSPVGSVPSYPASAPTVPSYGTSGASSPVASVPVPTQPPRPQPPASCNTVTVEQTIYVTRSDCQAICAMPTGEKPAPSVGTAPAVASSIATSVPAPAMTKSTPQMPGTSDSPMIPAHEYSTASLVIYSVTTTHSSGPAASIATPKVPGQQTSASTPYSPVGTTESHPVHSGPGSSSVPTPPAYVPSTSASTPYSPVGTTESHPVQSPPASSSVHTAPAYVPSSSASTPYSPVGTTESHPVQSSPATSSAPSGTHPSVPSTTQPACSTNAPELTTWISKSQPDTAYGNQPNASISEDCSSVYSFKIPQDYEGKQCSVVLHFPEQEGPGGGASTGNNQGSLAVYELNGPVSEKITYNTCPGKGDKLDCVAVQPGASHVVRKGPCKAGQTEAIELSSESGLQLEFAQAPPTGVYITAC